MANKTVKEKLATVSQARQNAVNPMTFMCSEADASSGATVGGLGSNYLTGLSIYAIQTYVNKATGVVTRADNKFGNIDVSNITSNNITCEDLTVSGTVSDGTPRNGFCGSITDVDQYASFVFDNDNRVGTFSFTDARDTDIYVNDVRFVIPDGDSRLVSAALPVDAEGWYQFYFDDDGQLKATKTTISGFFETKCLVVSLYYSQSNTGIPAGQFTGAEISILKQWHGAESIDWRKVHHRTEYSKVTENSFEVTTTSTESVPTSILSMSEGVIADEDIISHFDAVDGTTDAWVVFYFDGIDGNEPIMKRGPKTIGNLSEPYVLSEDISFPGAQSGHVICNNIAFDGDGVPTAADVCELQDGEYTIMHVLVGNGTIAHNVIVNGQNTYNSVIAARENILLDIRTVYLAVEVITEAVHVASFIIDYQGFIVPINDDGLMIADLRESEGKTIFGGSNEVVVPSGTGYFKTTRALSVGAITAEEQFKIDYLSSHPGEFLIAGAGGNIGSFDLLGTDSGSETTTDTTAIQQTTLSTSPTTYLEVMSVTIPSDYVSMSFTYSIDSLLYSSTQGMYVRVLINGTPYQEDLFDSVYSGGSPINISNTITNGSGTAGDEITVEVKANKNWQTCTVEIGSYLSVIGLTGGTAYFVERVDGVASGTHTFENLTVSGNLNVTGTLTLPSLPTSDPGISGRIWSDGGTLKVSA